MTLHHITIGRVGRGCVACAFGALALGSAMAGVAAADAPGSATVAYDTLTVTGTHADDHIALRLAPGAPGTLQVDFGDDGSAEASFDRSTFSSVVVLARNGDDVVRIDQSNGPFADEAITVDGSNGDDVLIGGDGVEHFRAGPGNDFMDGNKGTDSADFGPGSDTFQWDAGDGSDAVVGGSGFDTLVFNGNGLAERMSLTADGDRAVFLRDPGAVRMDLDGVERVDLHAFGGADTFTVGDLSGTDVRVVDADLGADQP